MTRVEARDMLKRFCGAACVIAVLLTVGCSDPLPPSAPSPVAPSLTDTYTSQLFVGGSNAHPFTVQAVGGVTVTLSFIQPGAAVGVGVGTPNGAQCSVLQSVTVVPNAAPQLVGIATSSGPFCVSVFDVGNLVETVTYTVTVFHS